MDNNKYHKRASLILSETKRNNTILFNSISNDPCIEKKVKDIIADKLGVSPSKIRPNASFINDLGADSLDIVELIMEFEKEFGISISEEESEKIRTVGDIVRYLEMNH